MINSCSCCHLQNKSAPHSPINTLYLSCLTLFHFMQWILLDLANSMLIQTLIHINRIIILVSIIHDPFSCHNSSMPYLQRGREGWGKENEKKIRRKLLNVKASPFSPSTSPLSLSIIQLCHSKFFLCGSFLWLLGMESNRLTDDSCQWMLLQSH